MSRNFATLQAHLGVMVTTAQRPAAVRVEAPPVPANGRELRRDVRIPTELAVTVHRRYRSLSLTTANISFRGMYLLSTAHHTLGELLDLEITLPDGAMRVCGRVVWQVPPDGPCAVRPGVGVQLYAASPETMRRWESFVRDMVGKGSIYER